MDNFLCSDIVLEIKSEFIMHKRITVRKHRILIIPRVELLPDKLNWLCHEISYCVVKNCYETVVSLDFLALEIILFLEYKFNMLIAWYDVISQEYDYNVRIWRIENHA